MISFYNDERLKELFSEIFDYGFKHKYHPKAIEDRIINSVVVNMLESNNDSFLSYKSNSELVRDVFSISVDERLDSNCSTLSIWIADSYLNLFFEFKKSFSYLFLYLPLEDAVKHFNLYHEMDISQLFSLFDDLTHRTSLLSKILREKKITTKQLSVLSGISINTLNGYSKNDLILYGARFDYVMLISQILHVKPNLFLRRLYISLSSYVLLTDKEKLQMNKDIYEYFNTKEITEKYIYDDETTSLKGKKIDVSFLFDSPVNSTEELIEMIKAVGKNNSKKVVVSNRDIGEFNNLNEDILIINKETYIQLKNNKSKPIPSIVKEYALIKAGETPYSFKK